MTVKRKSKSLLALVGTAVLLTGVLGGCSLTVEPQYVAPTLEVTVDPDSTEVESEPTYVESEPTYVESAPVDVEELTGYSYSTSESLVVPVDEQATAYIDGTRDIIWRHTGGDCIPSIANVAYFGNSERVTLVELTMETPERIMDDTPCLEDNGTWYETQLMLNHDIGVEEFNGVPLEFVVVGVDGVKENMPVFEEMPEWEEETN